MGRTAMTAEEKKLAAEKRAAAKKAAEEKTTMAVKADDIEGVYEDGTTVPLTELAPELAGETVYVEKEAVIAETEEKNEKEKTFSKAEVEDMIAAAVAKAMANAQTQAQAPNIIQYGGETERVNFLFQAPVSDDNVFEVGQGMYGRIVGKTGAFSVPKQELSRAMDGLFRKMMDKRWIIVVSGLTEEEKKIYGVNYKVGEVLGEKTFAHLADLGMGLVDVYRDLCKGNKEILEKAVYEAYAAGNKNVTRELAVALNEISKANNKGKGAFVSLIETMNADDLN